MENYANGPEIPMGFGMALAKNLNAMNYFSGLTKEQQQQVIQKTHSIESKAEMRAFVDSLVDNRFF